MAVIAIENTCLLNVCAPTTTPIAPTPSPKRSGQRRRTFSRCGSPGDLQPVFEAMLEKAVRVCEAKFGSLYRWDGDALQLVATHNMPPGFAEYRRRSPFRPSPKTATAPAVELGGSRTVMAVPMLKEHELIGAILVSRQEVYPFTDSNVVWITSNNVGLFGRVWGIGERGEAARVRHANRRGDRMAGGGARAEGQQTTDHRVFWAQRSDPKTPSDRERVR